MCFVFLPAKALVSGLPMNQAALLISALALGDTIGRFMFGWLANFKAVNNVLLFASDIFLCGAVTTIGGFLVTFPQHFIFACVFGLCMGKFSL